MFSGTDRCMWNVVKAGGVIPLVGRLAQQDSDGWALMSAPEQMSNRAPRIPAMKWFKIHVADKLPSLVFLSCKFSLIASAIWCGSGPVARFDIIPLANYAIIHRHR